MSATASTDNQRLKHHGQGTELFIIFIVNVVFKVLTLGIYHFWAKTRVRRYLWSQTSFDNERFEYTGRGLELFIGFLVAILGFIILIQMTAAIGTFMTREGDNPAALAPVLLASGFVILLIPVGIYSARRYLLSRTRWRSICFGLSGSAFGYAFRSYGLLVLSVITLGLLTPIVRNWIFSYEINNTCFGSEHFEYDGKGADLYVKFIIALVLSLPTFGIIWLWYFKNETEYRASHIHLQQMSFATDFTTGQFIWLLIGNLLLIGLTLGLAYPWVLIRNARFSTVHLQTSGQLHYAAIAQSVQKNPRMGEGLVEAFGMGGI